jgi:hypothetical protein
MAAPSRTRFSGEPEAMVAVLVRHMKVPSFLCYSENMNAPKQPAKIQRLKAFWQEVKLMQPSLLFSQKFMEQAFALAGSKCGQ